MSKSNFSKFEELSDFSIAFMDEIYRDIKSLSKYSSSKSDNKIDDLNRKIDRAREM
jgi:hypothetical protein